MRKRVAFALWAASLAVVHAQAPAGAGADKGEQPERVVRFLAVGDLPPFRQELRNGVAYELEPPEGSLPPRRLQVDSGREQRLDLTLSLGSPSAPLRLAGGLRELRLFEGPPDAPPWARVALPEQPVPGLVLLWRAPGADGKPGTWKSPAALWLREDAAQTAPRSVRVVNVSPAVAAVKFGKETVRVAPRAVWLRQHPGQGDVALSIAIATAAGEWQMLYAGAVDCTAEERLLAVVYRADGERPRRPAKAVILRERTAAVSKPPEP